MKPKIIGIILARKGSKAIKNKNLIKINGEPLITYTIKSAIYSKLDEVYVSTNSDEIIKIAEAYNLKIIERPEELAQHDSSDYSAMQHACNFLKKNNIPFDILVQLNPTSPLRISRDINFAIDKILKTKAAMLTSVSLTKDHPAWTFKAKNDTLIPLNPEYLEKRRQELPKFYTENGCIFAYTKNHLENSKRKYAKDITYIVLPKQRGLDIDGPEELELAKILIKKDKKTDIRIQNKIIGDNYPCFIIAEAGVNHDGCLKKAKKLVDIAKKANVDAIKFQTWDTDSLMIKQTPKADYMSRTNESFYNLAKRLELSYEEFTQLKEYCDKRKIIFLSTPDDEKSVDFLYNLKVPAFKISSGELTNLHLLKKIAKLNLPVILSTGMSNLNQIRAAIRTINSVKNNQIILLQCTSTYPTKPKDVHLRVMFTLQNHFSLHTGLSDHSLGIQNSIAAVAMGASVIEKHFTINKKDEGPDHKFSLSPNELIKLVKGIRRIERALGSFKKKPTKSELPIIPSLRKSIVTKTKIPKNTILEEYMLTTKRPGNGIDPSNLHYLIGKKTKRDLPVDYILGLDDLE